MATGRMFNINFMSTDSFMNLSHDAIVLYHYLNLNADDDGFIERTNIVMRMCDVKEESLEALIKKELVIRFKSGTTLIRHWKIHNHIRRDTYHPTICEEINEVSCDNKDIYHLKSDLDS